MDIWRQQKLSTSKNKFMKVVHLKKSAHLAKKNYPTRTTPPCCAATTGSYTNCRLEPCTRARKVQQCENLPHPILCA